METGTDTLGTLSALRRVSPKVARSLGITECLRKKETHPASAPECSSQEMKGQLQATSGQKREGEQAVVVSGAELTSV